MKDFKALLRIDKHSLDEELESQSEYLGEVGREAARLASVRDYAKDKLKRVEARRALEIRSEAGKRLTVDQIQAMVLVDKERRAALTAYLEADKAANEAEADREAWRSRGYALPALVTLFSAGYWVDVSLKGDAINEIEEKRAEFIRQEIAKKRKELRR